MKKNLFIIFLLLFIFSSCSVFLSKHNVQYHEENKEINLYVFIGKKISVTEFNPNKNWKNNNEFKIDSITGDTIFKRVYVMDYGFKAKYSVKKNIFNTIQSDTVVFTVYDHYGRPNFENYDYVLLYLSKNDQGNYYHQKYQYNPIKVRGKNKWSGLKGETIKSLFEEKKNGVLKAREVFN